ncbi:MAG: hypothetical protein JST68_21710 [Bacteroidetes bacterium]|nr:hypothetical protein [Bacteroidota bacterium]
MGLKLDRFLVGIIIFFMIIDIVPTLIAHVQYCLANWGSALIIDKQARMIRYISKAGDLSYHFGDIERLEHTASYGGGSWWYSFSEYRYFRIKFKDQKEIIVTSLMMKDIKFVLEPLLGISAHKKLKLVAFI